MSDHVHIIKHEAVHDVGGRAGDEGSRVHRVRPDRLEEPDISRGPLGEIFALGDRLVELCGPGYPVRICDIQSPLDIGALIWEKSAFFMALYEEPEAVHRLLRKVTDTLTAFIHIGAL